MIQLIYKGFFIVHEFNNLYYIRNDFGHLEAENFNSINSAKKIIDNWV